MSKEKGPIATKANLYNAKYHRPKLIMVSIKEQSFCLWSVAVTIEQNFILFCKRFVNFTALNWL